MTFKRSLLLPIVALLFPAVLLAQGRDDQNNGHTGRAPVLLAEISNADGASLLLTVYSDGDAVLARKDLDAPDGEICSAAVSPADLATLESSLREADATHLSDATPVPNLTRKTISVFTEQGESAWTHGNTFSYYRAEGPYLTVARAIGTVLSNNFASCE